MNMEVLSMDNYSQVMQDNQQAEMINKMLTRDTQLQPLSAMNMSSNQEEITQGEIVPEGQLVDQSNLNTDENGKGVKRRKEAETKVCMAAGCDKQIKRRRLCSTHQKQKERNSGKIELKEDFKDSKFTKGRSPTPFSKHANKYAKLKVFDTKIDQWAGGKEEGSVMLQSYIESSYFQARYPKHEDSKIYEQVGKNIVNFLQQLPEKSPLRKPLIKAMSEGLAPSRLTSILPISKRTIMYSKKLADNDNLLLTIRYKPNVTRKRPGQEEVVDANLANGDNQDDQQEDQIASDLANIHHLDQQIPNSLENAVNTEEGIYHN